MIIKIPDDNSIVKWRYKDNEDWKYAEISDLIKAYERPKGDLISREALKEAIETYDKFACLPFCRLEPFRNLEHPEMFVPYIHFDDVIKAIDNAPTEPQVTVFAENASKEEIGNFKQELENVLARPQGEWIKDEEHSITINMFKCSNCNGGGYPHFKYCPHCGADMKGGKEE